MPTQEEMTLIFQVYDLLIALSGDYVEIEYSIEGYQDKMAIQSLYMIELYINFLDTLDATYFETVIDEIEFTEPESEYDSPMLTEMAGAEIGILTIKYFAEFKQDNQALIDLLSEVFTDEEKEIMFDDYIDALGADEMFTTTMINQLKALDFQQVLYLDVMLGDLFDTFLDIFVETDGEVIRLAVQLGAFEWDYYSDTYLNRVTGEVYIYGRKCYAIGANDEKAIDRIQGITAAVSYGYEVILWPESFFTMLLSRLSVKNSKLFGNR